MKRIGAALCALLLLFSLPSAAAAQAGVSLPVFLTFYRMPLWGGTGRLPKMPTEMLSEEKMHREDVADGLFRFEQEVQGLKISGTALTEGEIIVTLDAWLVPLTNEFSGAVLCLASGLFGNSSGEFIDLISDNLNGSFTYRGFNVTSDLLQDDPTYFMKLAIEWAGE